MINRKGNCILKSNLLIGVQNMTLKSIVIIIIVIIIITISNKSVVITKKT